MYSEVSQEDKTIKRKYEAFKELSRKIRKNYKLDKMRRNCEKKAKTNRRQFFPFRCRRSASTYLVTAGTFGKSALGLLVVVDPPYSKQREKSQLDFRTRVVTREPQPCSTHCTHCCRSNGRVVLCCHSCRSALRTAAAFWCFQTDLVDALSAVLRRSVLQ